MIPARVEQRLGGKAWTPGKLYGCGEPVEEVGTLRKEEWEDVQHPILGCARRREVGCQLLKLPAEKRFAALDLPHDPLLTARQAS